MNISDMSRFQSIASGFQTLNDQLQQLELEQTTGKQLNVPSDNPVGTSQVLSISADLSAITQYQQNAANVQTNLSTEDSVETTLKTILSQAQSTVTGVDNASPTDPSRQSAVTQLQQLLQQVVQLANTQVGDSYIFGGYKTQTPPLQTTTGGTSSLMDTSVPPTEGTVTVSGTAAVGVYQLSTDSSGNVTLTNESNPTQTQTIAGVTNATTSLNFNTLGITLTAGSGFSVAALDSQTIAATNGYSYQGDDNRQQVAIDTNQTVSGVHTGNELFGNTIAALQGAIQSLQNGSSSNVAASAVALGNAQTQVLGLQAENGVSLQQLQNVAAAQTNRQSSDETNQGNIENISAAQVATEILAVQNALQAAYSAASRIMGLSLANYLSSTTG